MAGRRKRGPTPISQIYKPSLPQYLVREGLLRPRETKAVGIKLVTRNGRNLIVTIILLVSAACCSFIRGYVVEFLFYPRMILDLLIAACANGWLHLRPDIVVLRLVEGALHPIEQSPPVGGDR